MRWSGQPKVLGADGNVDPSYVPVSYTWKFPTPGAVKGYGKFTQETERAAAPGVDPGAYWLFTGGPGPVAASDHEYRYPGLKYTPDDLSYQSNLAANPNQEDSDHVINSFYWGPDAVGKAKVEVTATFVKLDAQGNVVPNSQITGTDEVAINVIRPKGNIDVTDFGHAGVSKPENGKQWLQFDKDAVHAGDSTLGSPIQGIEYNGIVNAPAPFAGSFIITQTELHHAELVVHDATRSYEGVSGLLPDGSDPGIVLDASPYPGSLNSKTGTATSVTPVGQKIFLLILLFGETCDTRRVTPRPVGSGATPGDTACR